MDPQLRVLPTSLFLHLNNFSSVLFLAAELTNWVSCKWIRALLWIFLFYDLTVWDFSAAGGVCV